MVCQRSTPMTPKRLLRLAICSAAVIGCAVATHAAEPLEICWGKTAVELPEWMQNAVIYEINVRQYSNEGTFAAVEKDLPRIHDLGANILWFMPIHPIGEMNRKGTLGSYYSVRDYETVNPAFGTEGDFKHLVDAAHALGFHVILDWVANHAAWDNVLTATHPDYFMHDAKGSFIPPLGFDWTDVIQMDFKNPEVVRYHARAMTHWIRDFGIDGFRCDYATGVPTTFWNTLAQNLRGVRPDLFLLAEAEVPQQQLAAFNASYTFDMMHAINDVAQGREPLSRIDDLLTRDRLRFPDHAARLYYTTNHDENSWQGTVWERLGGGVRPFAILTFMLDGIPLIYDGQEAGLDKRLEFFEHDPIAWRPGPLTGFYRTLCHLKTSNPALRTGSSMRRIATTENGSVYAILREGEDARVICFLNLTARDVTFDTADEALAGDWEDVFTNQVRPLESPVSMTLRSWEYRVYQSR